MALKRKSNIGDQERSETRMGRGKPINNLQHLRLSFYELESQALWNSTAGGCACRRGTWSECRQKGTPTGESCLALFGLHYCNQPQCSAALAQNGETSLRSLATAALQHSLFAASGDSEERSVHK